MDQAVSVYSLFWEPLVADVTTHERPPSAENRVPCHVPTCPLESAASSLSWPFRLSYHRDNLIVPACGSQPPGQSTGLPIPGVWHRHSACFGEAPCFASHQVIGKVSGNRSDCSVFQVPSS